MSPVSPAKYPNIDEIFSNQAFQVIPKLVSKQPKPKMASTLALLIKKRESIKISEKE